MQLTDSELNKAKNFLKDLEDRDLLYQCTNRDSLISLLASGKRIYMGIDPTADFLHLGHYAGLFILKRFISAGYPVVILIGSLTARIGDPSFRSKSRKFNPNIEQNGRDIAKQLRYLFRKELEQRKGENTPMCEIIDNYEFHNRRLKSNATFQDLPIDILLEFIDEVCSELKVVELANRDFLYDRLHTGLTVAEFLYTGLQGWDFLHLFRDKNVAIQIGGSDQWGNMITGLHLISKYKERDEEELRLEDSSDAGVITFPLVNDGKGNKFGKSEGNAICITGGDADKNIYSVRQYFINAPDDQIRDYLLKFTFLPIEEIDSLLEKKDIREVKNELADHICKDIFGEIETLETSSLTKEISQGLMKRRTYDSLLKLAQYAPSSECIWTDDLQLFSLFKLVGLVKSNSEFNRLANSNGIYVSGSTPEDLKREGYKLKSKHVTWKDSDEEKGIVLIRKGKKQLGLIHIHRAVKVFGDV